MSTGEQRIRSYIDGYADGRKDALRDVKATMSQPHEDQDILEAAIGLRPAERDNDERGN